MKKRKSVESNYCLRNIDVFYILHCKISRAWISFFLSREIHNLSIMRIFYFC